MLTKKIISCWFSFSLMNHRTKKKIHLNKKKSCVSARIGIKDLLKGCTTIV